MIIGVDGTGSDSARDYERAMSASFVRKLVSSYPGANRRYFRGPTLAGMQTGQEAEAVRDAVLSLLREGDREIILTGYSRGGAAVIAAAQLLEKSREFADLWRKGPPRASTANACLASDERPRIACLALFDAVDRSTKVDTKVIPANVEVVFHATCDYYSRCYFGQTGTQLAGSGRLVTRRFTTTHAGMGGLPGAGDSMLGPWGWLPAPALFLASHKEQLRQLEFQESARVQTWMWSNVSTIAPFGAPMSISPLPLGSGFRASSSVSSTAGSTALVAP